jgi:hypothetical protein
MVILWQSVPTRDIVADPVKIIKLSENMNNPEWQELSSLIDIT